MLQCCILDKMKETVVFWWANYTLLNATENVSIDKSLICYIEEKK